MRLNFYCTAETLHLERVKSRSHSYVKSSMSSSLTTRCGPPLATSIGGESSGCPTRLASLTLKILKKEVSELRYSHRAIMTALLVSSCATEAFRLRKTLSKVDQNGAKLASSLRDDCEAFKLYLPLVHALATPAMKRRHWIRLCEEVLEANVDKHCSLELLVELGVIEHLDMIEAISLRAEKEYSVERNLRIMQEEWMGVSMDVVQYKETEGYVLTKESCEQIFDLLDEHLVKTQTAISSPFVKPILSIAQGWQRKLSYAHGLLEELLACQRRWTYLEPIFRSDDIKKQMPTEAMR